MIKTHTYFLGVLAFSCSLLWSSCRKDTLIVSQAVNGPKPASAFSYTVNANNSLEVTFQNTSSEAESVFWNFGDGTTSKEFSPTHIYPASAKYTVILIAQSAAGYIDRDTLQVVAAAPAVAEFSYSSFLLQTEFKNNSTGTSSILWDFGDNSTSTESNPEHEYQSAGTYTVKLKVTGLGGDEVIKTQSVTVSGNKNLVKGGAFNEGSAKYWTAYQKDNAPVFGYTGDKPIGGSGGVLRFPSFENWSNSKNELIYQAVQVEQGKRYKLSALVKAPAGGWQCYFQFFVSEDASYWQDMDNGGNQLLSLNTWHGWGGGSNSSVAVNGDLANAVSQNGNYGFGAATGGVHTAPKTGTVYIGVQAGTWSGSSNGDWLVDNLAFEVLP